MQIFKDRLAWNSIDNGQPHTITKPTKTGGVGWWGVLNTNLPYFLLSLHEIRYFVPEGKSPLCYAGHKHWTLSHHFFSFERGSSITVKIIMSRFSFAWRSTLPFTVNIQLKTQIKFKKINTRNIEYRVNFGKFDI